MKLPKQAQPVVRPDLIQPNTVLNFEAAPNQFDLAAALLNGANYNNPMNFSTPVDFCGCHLLFGNSEAMCQEFCLF